jgi:diguanylate cyclase (GGDEF)-like protein
LAVKMQDCGGREAGEPSRACLEALLGSYRRLADVFRELLSAPALGSLLEEIADALSDLVPYDALTIYRIDEGGTVLLPVLARDQWAEEILQTRVPFGRGITGWAALSQEAVWANQAHLDPRVHTVPGTPADEPEALICIPLLGGRLVRGALNLYRLGENAAFSEADFELARRFGDAAALALAQAEMRERLEEEARTDALTGLANRRAFCERLASELQRSERALEPVGLVMLDIDDFKQVNDRFGHGVGDQALIELARALEGAVRNVDLVCRLGGEEFALILPGATRELACEIGARIRTTVPDLSVHGIGTITLSIGVATGNEGTTADELFERADAALMAVKRSGKDGVCVAAS